MSTLTVAPPNPSRNTAARPARPHGAHRTLHAPPDNQTSQVRRPRSHPCPNSTTWLSVSDRYVVEIKATSTQAPTSACGDRLPVRHSRRAPDDHGPTPRPIPAISRPSPTTRMPPTTPQPDPTPHPRHQSASPL